MLDNGNLDLDKLEEAKSNGKKIGLVQGSWDLFHLGHLRYIKKARELCDYLIIAMDSDEKIRKRKGNGRPIIPEDERYNFIKLLDIADDLVIKKADEKKWELIKKVRPDVLVAIKENYNEEQIKNLEEYCGQVAILPRQSESSTSDKIRKITIAEQRNRIDNLDEKVNKAIEEFKTRVNYNDNLEEPIPSLITHMKESTDWVTPVAAACFCNGEWHFGTNKANFNIPKGDVENRSELYYATVEHAEINLLKKLGNVEKIDSPIYVTLFPCDKCMKVLISKGVKKVYYLEDHLDKNWSKRSHELAKEKGVETICLLDNNKQIDETEKVDYNQFKYIYPPNARGQEQLDIMMNKEMADKDPLDPNVIEQEILFTANYWYVSKNRFPHQDSGEQFLIISKYPVYDIEDMSAEMWTELGNLWVILKNSYNLNGGSLCFRYGDPELSGASLKRLHAHVIMPNEEKVRFPIGGHKVLKKGLTLKRK